MAEQTVAEVICPACGGSSFASRGVLLAVGAIERPPAPPAFQPRHFAEEIEHRLQCRDCLHMFATHELF